MQYCLARLFFVLLKILKKQLFSDRSSPRLAVDLESPLKF